MADRREVLIEMTRVGASVRVAAVDAETGLEAVIVGPATYPAHILERRAVAKLEHLRQHKASPRQR